MFFAFAGFTVIYFITSVFFLPETKGKTLEEIGGFFEGRPGPDSTAGSNAPLDQGRQAGFSK